MVQLVGILNVTPDSFSDGGNFIDPETAIQQADQLFNDGATLVDIGAESTRPNAEVLSDEKEWSRLEPILKVLIPKYPGKLSLDTYHPSTVKKAWAIGPIIINDVTGFNNPEMVNAVAKLRANVIVSHLPPDMTIQQAHELTPVTSVDQVKDELLEKAKELEAAGLSRKQIILDPGIGFGKTPEVNRQLLSFARLVPQYAVMIGYSRKRFLGENRMDVAVNLEAGTIATKSGAVYLRVHDVRGHAKFI
ncbi:dihydropteroate synthase [Patescibacteria group bacterium]|nr:MAG: dihydropteroate synthase [Patescibacteria group bacterium]